MRLRTLGHGALALAAASAVYGLALRPRHLRWGATEAEVARRWPGDDLIAAPSTRAVHAVTVQAPAGVVWRWNASSTGSSGSRKMMLTIKALAETSS